MKLKEIIALMGLAALWGASFLFIKMASPVFGPLLTIQLRVTIAAAALVLFLAASRKSAHFKQRWKQYLIIGALNAAIPFTLIATAELILPASMSAILNSLTPLFTALVVSGWMKETLSIRKWLGILIGVIGVAILVGWSSQPFTTKTLIAIGLSILSTISYGFAGVYAKKAFVGVSPLSLAYGQQAGAAILLVPFTIFHLPASTDDIPLAAVLAVVGLAIFCTAIAYLIFFYLIDSVGPTKTLSVTFLVPVFGIIWGIIFLHEKFTIGMLVGLIVISVSVFFITDVKLRMTALSKKVES